MCLNSLYYTVMIAKKRQLNDTIMMSLCSLILCCEGWILKTVSFYVPLYSYMVRQHFLMTHKKSIIIPHEENTVQTEW